MSATRYPQKLSEIATLPKISITPDWKMQSSSRGKSSNTTRRPGSRSPGRSPSTEHGEPREPAKKRALRRENWETHRATIKRLYIDEGKKLNDIVEIMNRDYNFTANARMYKHRLSQWGLIKYNRESDVQLILQLRNKREAEGKDSHIEINGRVVDFDRVQRYLQRRKISVEDFVEENFEESRSGNNEEDDALDLDADSPTITIRTPSPMSSAPSEPPLSPSLLRSPAPFQVAEEVLWDARAFAAEVTVDPDGGGGGVLPSPEGFALLDSVMMISELMEQQNPGRAGEYMQLASTQVQDLIRLQPQEAVLCLYEATLILARAAPEVAGLLLRHAADITAVFVAAEAHPMRHLLAKLAEIAGGVVASGSSGGSGADGALVLTASRAFSCHLDTWDRVLGRDSERCVYWRMRCLRVAGQADEALDAWIQCSDHVIRAAEEERAASRRHRGAAGSGRAATTGSPPRSEADCSATASPVAAGVPLERGILLARYEIASACSSAAAYRMSERLIARCIRRCRETGARSGQAYHEFALAAIAREANRVAEAAELGRAAVATYTAAGNVESAAKVGAWMERWDWDQDLDPSAYRLELMNAAFGDAAH